MIIDNLYPNIRSFHAMGMLLECLLSLAQWATYYFFLKWHSYFTALARLPFCTIRSGNSNFSHYTLTGCLIMERSKVNDSEG